MQITLIENFRAVFYAPFYAAMVLGAYRAEGLDVRMITPDGTGKTNELLAAGGGEVSWGGPMRLMLALDKDPGSETVAFCEVVGRDPFFLIGRTPNENFQFSDLLGKTVATVSEVPTPWVCLQRDLQLAGVDPSSLKRVSDRSMAENSKALRRGEVDVIQVFQPYAHDVLSNGAGHLWMRAADRGLACYTTLNTTRSFIDRHPDPIAAMTRAIYRTQKWIAAHSGNDLAQAVASWLPDVSRETLAACFDGYKSSNVWSTRPVVQREGLEWKRDAMLACGAIRTEHPYEQYVSAQFAEQAVRDDPPRSRVSGYAPS